METNAVSLQEKIQRLIDQYTEDKKKLDKLELQNNDLREENSQLMAQIESMNKSHSGSGDRIKELEQQVKTLEKQYKELQDTISGFEDVATDAISKIDSIFPDLGNHK
jgi:chromosome segregation ATPase